MSRVIKHLTFVQKITQHKLGTFLLPSTFSKFNKFPKQNKIRVNERSTVTLPSIPKCVKQLVDKP